MQRKGIFSRTVLDTGLREGMKGKDKPVGDRNKWARRGEKRGHSRTQAPRTGSNYCISSNLRSTIVMGMIILFYVTLPNFLNAAISL